MLDPQRRRPEGTSDPLRLALVEPRPRGVVLREVDRRRVRLELADRRGLDLLVAERGGHASDGSAGPTPVLPGGGETEDATSARQDWLRHRLPSPFVERAARFDCGNRRVYVVIANKEACGMSTVEKLQVHPRRCADGP